MGNYDDSKDKLMEKLRFIKNNYDTPLAERLKPDMLERCINRIISYSPECGECMKFTMALDKLLGSIIDGWSSRNYNLYGDYSIYLKKIIQHLQKKHRLFEKGCYVRLCMFTGISLGAPAGLFFKNYALGICCGMLVGLIIGLVIEAVAKKNGLMI